MRKYSGRLLSFLIAMLVAVLASLPFIGTPAANASTASFAVGMKLKGGPGHASTVYAGIWNLNGKRGPCIDFGRRTPNGDGTFVIKQTPGMTLEQSRQSFKLVQKYRGTGSSFTAAALALSVWKLRGDSDFRSWYSWATRTNAVGPKLEGRVNSMLREAKSHGPYRVGVRLQPVLPGQNGIGTVTVRDSRGKAASGIKVSVSRTTKGARILRGAGTTNRYGRTTFKYHHVSGKVGFKATVRVPSVKKALLSVPSAGSQRLLVGGFMENFSGSAQYESSAGKPTVITTCDTDCDGQATVTVKYCNPLRNGSAIRWVGTVSGSVVLKLEAPRGKCGSKALRLNDGNVISMKYCALTKVGGTCKSGYVKQTRTYEVVCPASPKAVIELACSCDPDDTGMVTFDPLLAGNPRYYTGYVIINGGTVVRPVPLAIGESKTVDIGQIKAGTTIEVTFKSWKNPEKTLLLTSGTLQSVTVN